ncbi:MAG: DNA-binding protein [Armatimonadota bacterium]|nr:DNA-binding protein [Armatimonadota bacterium]
MRTQTAECGRLVVVRMDYGEDVLECIEGAASQNGIRDGLILAGAGSLCRYHLHVVRSTNMPPGNAFVEGEGPFDILTVTGMVLDGRVHAHITFADAQKAMGGHLERGCRVLTFAVVVLAETPGARLAGWDQVGTLP